MGGEVEEGPVGTSEAEFGVIAIIGWDAIAR